MSSSSCSPANGGRRIRRVSPTGWIESLGGPATAAPSGLVVWSRESKIKPPATMTLVAMPSRVAATLDPVPARCHDYVLDGVRYRHKAEPINLGTAGYLISSTIERREGVAHSFGVTFRGPGYLAILQGFGHRITRDVALGHARLWHERIRVQLR